MSSSIVRGLRKAAVVAAIGGALIGGGCERRAAEAREAPASRVETNGEAPGAESRPEASEKFPALGKIGRRYGIDVMIEDPGFPVRTYHGPIDGTVAREESLEEYVPIFEKEFNLYPVRFVAQTRLCRVVLCERLSFKGEMRKGVPDYEHATMYLDVASRGIMDRPYLAGVIHHEFFHVADYADDWHVYEDPLWVSLNADGFSYGSFGKAESRSGIRSTKYSGFLNHYSTTGLEEDKAEIFSNLVLYPAYVRGRAKSDAVIETKVEQMKVLLTDFCREMDDRFWTRVWETRQR